MDLQLLLYLLILPAFLLVRFWPRRGARKVHNPDRWLEGSAFPAELSLEALREKQDVREEVKAMVAQVGVIYVPGMDVDEGRWTCFIVDVHGIPFDLFTSYEEADVKRVAVEVAELLEIEDVQLA